MADPLPPAPELARLVTEVARAVAGEVDRLNSQKIRELEARLAAVEANLVNVDALLHDRSQYFAHVLDELRSSLEDTPRPRPTMFN